MIEKQTGSWRKLCRWCGRDMIRLAFGPFRADIGTRDTVELCELCDEATVSVCWGEA